VIVTIIFALTIGVVTGILCFLAYVFMILYGGGVNSKERRKRYEAWEQKKLEKVKEDGNT